MKFIWFHMQGYRELPKDFEDRYESVWVTPPTDELCDPRKVQQYLNWNLDELDYAASLGYDGVGTNEHHQNGYGFPVSPSQTGYYLAKSTKDQAIVILGNTLPLYNPPIRVAEEIAFIDCLSGGRVVAGMPVGSPMDVAHCYGITPTQTRPRYYEAHDLIKQAWTRKGPFHFNGKYTKLRNVNVWPKPIQQPHPPIWLAGGGSVETWDFAAQQDYTYSYLSFGGRAAAKPLMDGFWETIDKAGKDTNPYRAGFAQIVFVGETDAEAEKLYLEHARYFYKKSLHVAQQFAAVPGYVTQKSLKAAVKRGDGSNPFASAAGIDSVSWKHLVDDSKKVIGGSPATVIDQLKDLASDLRCGHIILLMQLGSMDHELTKYNTRLFAEKVLPHVRDIWDDQWHDHWWPSGARRPALPASADRVQLRKIG